MKKTPPHITPTLAKHTPCAGKDFKVRTADGLVPCSRFQWAIAPGSHVETRHGVMCVDDLDYAEAPNGPGATYLQFWIGEDLVKQSSVVTKFTFKE